MFFCGDVAVSGRNNNLNYRFDFADGRQAIFLNLEGPLCTQAVSETLVSKRRVFNIDRIIDLFQRNGVTGCILANNHITDFDDYELTVSTLDKAGVKHTGYGLNIDEAKKPIYFSEDGITYSLLAFGWNVTGCRYARNNKRGVNALELNNVITQIQQEKSKGNKVIAVFHWNYTYELYPMPIHRELAKMAVDAGADLIIGCHPHCIQGIEYYKDTPIVYSVGNWMFDNDVYFSGRLSTKEEGFDELVVEYKQDVLICHWYRYDPDTRLPVHINSEDVNESSAIKKLIPYEGMDNETYAAWFKKNRNIHRLMPVFTSDSNRIRNKLYCAYIFTRDRILRKVRDGIRCMIGL